MSAPRCRMNPAKRCTILCELFILPLLFIANSNMYGLVVGANNATAIEAFTSFPQTDTNNTMLGFGSFTNGFGLATPQTTCTFNDFFPVGGPIYMNGGTLYLQEDLVCSSSTFIYTGGTINAQRRAVVFENASSSTMPMMQGNSTAGALTSATASAATVQAISWSYDDQYLAITYLGRQFVYAFSGSQLTFQVFGVSSPQNVYAGQWHPAGYDIVWGQIVGGNNLDIYRFNPVPKTFSSVALRSENSTIHAVDWNATGTYLLISRQDSPCLKVYSFNVTTSAFAAIATATAAGHPVYDSTYGIYNTVSWNSNNNYFAGISTDTAHAALTIYSFNGSTISEIMSVTADRLPSAVDWSPTSSFIAVSFDDATPSANWLRIYKFDPLATPSLTQVISYPSTPTGFATAVSWSRDGTQLACGVFSNGINTFNAFVFNPSPPTLTPAWASASLPNYVFSCDWAHSDNYIATGANNSGLATVYGFNSPHGIVFNSANLKFSGDVYLNTPPIIFQGNCILDGHNCGLYLGSSGITVASGSSLLLKDLTIYNVTGTNISCVDNTSTISFRNVIWRQSGDVTFPQGQLAIVGELLMTGSGKFIYQSDQASTIYDHATWYFDNGMTFSYCPTHGAYDRIAFQNNASTLYLYGTNLYAAATGLHLIKGCLMIEGPCPFISDGATEANGIWIGDGTAADDLKVKILAESGIIVEKGYASYRNVK